MPSLAQELPAHVTPRVNTLRDKPKVFEEKNKVIHDASISVSKHPTAVLIHIMDNIEKCERNKKTNVESN